MSAPAAEGTRARRGVVAHDTQRIVQGTPTQFSLSGWAGTRASPAFAPGPPLEVPHAASMPSSSPRLAPGSTSPLGHHGSL
jgi:hypothetical protein